MTISRNAPCPCNSGKKYRNCCGAVGERPAPLRFRALEAHKAEKLDQAESLYRAALAADPKDVDVLHMLGVVLFQKLRLIEALERLWIAAEKTAWREPDIRHNIGLVVARLLAHKVYPAQVRLLESFRSWDTRTEAARTVGAPLVSVILPTYNHARYVGQAIASVLAQTYPNMS